jgi:hypothetical protein
VRERRTPLDPHAQIGSGRRGDAHLLRAREARRAGARPLHHQRIGAQAVERVARLNRHQGARARVERRTQVRVVMDAGRRHRHNELASEVERR